MPSILRPLALLGALAILGCRETTGPIPASGATFVLRSVDASPVPVLLYETTGSRVYLTADTLVLDGRGQSADITIVRSDSLGAAYSDVQRFVRAGSYEVDQSTIQFDYYCPLNALCSAPPVGWLEADGSLTLAYRDGKGWSNVKRYEPVR